MKTQQERNIRGVSAISWAARRGGRWMLAAALVSSLSPLIAIATDGTSSASAVGSVSPTTVPQSTLQRSLSIVKSFRDNGPLTIISTSNGPASGAGPARAQVDGRDSGGEVVINVVQPSSGLAAVTAWDGGSTSEEWSFNPSSVTSPVTGPERLATTVSRLDIAAGKAPSPSGAAATGGVQPDGTIGWCLVGVVTPVLQGSPYGPLIAFSGAVGFCTVSPVLITDTLILWQYKGGGYNEVGSSSAGGTNSDTDGSVVPCYSPWSTYYAFHSQMIVALSYAGSAGYGYVNSPDGSLNCDS